MRPRIDLETCRICGRRPHVKIRENENSASCAIWCKPLFGRMHGKVRAYAMTPAQALHNAARTWDERNSDDDDA